MHRGERWPFSGLDAKNNGAVLKKLALNGPGSMYKIAGWMSKILEKYPTAYRRIHDLEVRGFVRSLEKRLSKPGGSIDVYCLTFKGFAAIAGRIKEAELQKAIGENRSALLEAEYQVEQLFSSTELATERTFDTFTGLDVVGYKDPIAMPHFISEGDGTRSTFEVSYKTESQSILDLWESICSERETAMFGYLVQAPVQDLVSTYSAGIADVDVITFLSRAIREKIGNVILSTSRAQGSRETKVLLDRFKITPLTQDVVESFVRLLKKSESFRHLIRYSKEVDTLSAEFNYRKGYEMNTACREVLNDYIIEAQDAGQDKAA